MRPVSYVDMIRIALSKLPGRQGNLPTVCAYIEVRSAEALAVGMLPWPSESRNVNARRWWIRVCLSMNTYPGTHAWAVSTRGEVELLQRCITAFSSLRVDALCICPSCVLHRVNTIPREDRGLLAVPALRECPVRDGGHVYAVVHPYNPGPYFLPFCAQEHFHDRLNWRSESSLRRTPAWKASIRRTLSNHASFCHAGTPERNVYTIAD